MKHLLLTTCCILSFATTANAIATVDGPKTMPIISTTKDYVPTKIDRPVATTAPAVIAGVSLKTAPAGFGAEKGWNLDTAQREWNSQTDAQKIAYIASVTKTPPASFVSSKGLTAAAATTAWNSLTAKEKASFLINPTSLASSTSSSTALDNKLTTEVRTAQNAATADVTKLANQTIKELGGGFYVTSEGKIYAAGNDNPLAMLDSAGNVLSASDKKLDAVTQSALNKLTKDINLPMGFGENARTPGTFIQKNTYVAASDDGSVYYGNGGIGANGLPINSIAAAIVKAAVTSASGSTNTSGAAAGYSVQPGSNQILSPSGQVVATYNPATGQFTSVTGATISPTSNDYAVYKAALTNATTPTSGQTVVAATPSASRLSLQPGSNEILNAGGQVVARYNPASGQFTTTAGVIVPPTSNDYTAYKQALVSGYTTTALR